MNVFTRTAALSMLLAGSAAATFARPESISSPPANILAGPKVASDAAGATLVQRDETGKVRRLDVPPAEAALELLELDDASRAKAQEILDERAAAIDSIVRENLQLLARLANAGKAKEKSDQRQLYRELAEKAEPLRARGPLADELASVLPQEKAEQLRTYVGQYYEAIAAEDHSPAADAPDLMGEESDQIKAPQETRQLRGRRARGVHAVQLIERLGGTARKHVIQQ